MLRDQVSKLNPDQQIALLRVQSQQFEVLHSAQVLQLKNWPFGCLTNIEVGDIDVDFKTQVVKYKWKRTNKAKTKPKNLDKLEASIKFLLGDEWTLQVKLDNKIIWPT
jgi:hypothetical protein